MTDYYTQVIEDFMADKITCEHEFVILNRDVNCFECQDCKALFDANAIPRAPDGNLNPSNFVNSQMQSPYSGPDLDYDEIKKKWEGKVGDVCSKYLQKNLPFTGYTRWDQENDIVDTDPDIEWGEGNETE